MTFRCLRNFRQRCSWTLNPDYGAVIALGQSLLKTSLQALQLTKFALAHLGSREKQLLRSQYYVDLDVQLECSRLYFIRCENTSKKIFGINKGLLGKNLVFHRNVL